MELLAYGHAGMPLIVFPTSMGRFYDYEDRGMIGAVGYQYDAGRLQAFCVDSVDTESWYNRRIPPRDRVLRHLQYENYLIHEVVPFIRSKNPVRLAVTGCSFGGYHAVNFALRHPGTGGPLRQHGRRLRHPSIPERLLRRQLLFQLPAGFSAQL